MGVATALTEVPASLEGSDWIHDAFAEEGRLTSGMVYTPFTAMSLRDFEGRYFNVKDRVRASYVSPLAATRRPVRIWFFGGSTTFGFDLQRDQHTIPSEFVRLAEDRGLAVEVRNYGSGGYVNYQESVLLSLLVTAGQAPDLAVFYDGTNDTGLATFNDFAGLNARGEPGDAFALTLRHALVESRWVPDATARPPAPLGLRPSPKPVTSDQTVRDVVGVYGQGVDLSRVLAESYGFRVAHFWQPDIYSKRPLDDAEAQILLSSGRTRSDVETEVGLSERVRQTLPAGVIDISDALDHLSGPILSDIVHTNERGARAVAEAMYRRLEPQLVELSSGS
jgi:lysophospholipase L1-like esterase